MAKNVILLLSISRGGTHFAADVLLSSPSVGALIEPGVFWQLYHKSKTIPDEVVSTTDPKTPQVPGYNFQFQGPHQEIGRPLTYRELFLAASANCGTSSASPLSLDVAKSTYARGLEQISQPYGLIFNKFTLSMAQTDPFPWSLDDCVASLDYLYQFFAEQDSYRLITLAVLRNPYDTFLGLEFLGVPAQEALLRIRSYDAVLSHIKGLGKGARIIRYEDMVSDFRSFREMLEIEYGITVSPDFAINKHSTDKPHGDMEDLRESVRGTIYEEYYALKPVVRSITPAQVKRYTLLQLKLLWYLVANKESQGGGSAINSLNPLLKKVITRLPLSRSRYQSFIQSRRWESKMSGSRARGDG